MQSDKKIRKIKLKGQVVTEVALLSGDLLFQI